MAVYGPEHRVGDLVAKYVYAYADGETATLLGGGQAIVAGAALANGTFGHSVDYDDPFESMPYIRPRRYSRQHWRQQNTTELGEYLRSRLRGVDSPNVGVVRGKELFIGAEFVDGDGNPDKELVKTVRKRCYENGVLVWKAGGERPPVAPAARHDQRASRDRDGHHL